MTVNGVGGFHPFLGRTIQIFSTMWIVVVAVSFMWLFGVDYGVEFTNAIM